MGESWLGSKHSCLAFEYAILVHSNCKHSSLPLGIKQASPSIPEEWLLATGVQVGLPSAAPQSQRQRGSLQSWLPRPPLVSAAPRWGRGTDQPARKASSNSQLEYHRNSTLADICTHWNIRHCSTCKGRQTVDDYHMPHTLRTHTSTTTLHHE